MIHLALRAPITLSLNDAIFKFGKRFVSQVCNLRPGEKMFLNILSKVNQVHTYLVFADCYWFYQIFTAAQRSRVAPWEKTQQHNNSNTLHPLDGSNLAPNTLFFSVYEAPSLSSTLSFFFLSSGVSLRCLAAKDFFHQQSPSPAYIHFCRRWCNQSKQTGETLTGVRDWWNLDLSHVTV